jgi:ADP-glucose pyrophosphorylase
MDVLDQFAVALGFATHVSENSQIEDSVIMPESWIGPSCRLNRCIVGPGVELPAEFEATSSMICAPPTQTSDRVASIPREAGLAVIPIDDLE